LQALNTLHPDITAAGGQILVVTSESQAMADAAKAKWKLPLLRLVGDPSISFARTLKTEGLLDVFISVPDAQIEPWTAGHPFMSSYTNGCAQPATLVVSRDYEVWFSHTVVPSTSNGGGAVDRPQLEDVWSEVQSKKLSSSGSGTIDANSPRIRKQNLRRGYTTQSRM